MATKPWLFLSLIVVLFIASEVAARDLAENSENKNKEKEEKIHTEQNGGGPLPPAYGGGAPLPPAYGGGAPLPPAYGGGAPLPPAYGGGGRGRGYCPNGCCYRGYYGGCSRCCAYAGEAVQAHPGRTEPAH